MSVQCILHKIFYIKLFLEMLHLIQENLTYPTVVLRLINIEGTNLKSNNIIQTESVGGLINFFLYFTGCQAETDFGL